MHLACQSLRSSFLFSNRNTHPCFPIAIDCHSYHVIVVPVPVPVPDYQQASIIE
jgi:hypothetical protein